MGWDGSNMGQLSSLKHLSIDMEPLPNHIRNQVIGRVGFQNSKEKLSRKSTKFEISNQLKKLGLGMDTSGAPFDSSKAIWSLANLLHLELEFMEFSSQKQSKILRDIIERLKLLEVLVLEKTSKVLSQKGLQQMKERLVVLMKESLNLKLIIFANMESEEMIIFRSNNYSWSEINPIVVDLSFDKNIKIRNIKSYQERREVNLYLPE